MHSCFLLKHSLSSKPIKPPRVTRHSDKHLRYLGRCHMWLFCCLVCTETVTASSAIPSWHSVIGENLRTLEAQTGKVRLKSTISNESEARLISKCKQRPLLIYGTLFTPRELSQRSLRFRRRCHGSGWHFSPLSDTEKFCRVLCTITRTFPASFM